MPPDTYAPIHATQGGVSPVATAVGGAIVGALAGAGFVASRKLSASDPAGPAAPDKQDNLDVVPPREV
jgi:hypothetical protein